MVSAESIPKRLRAALGDDDFIQSGIVQVAATWRAPDGALRVIRIAEGAPPSETDHFLLRAARMRSDAIVTTGKILRDEPTLTHDEVDPELLAWRRNELGRVLPPLTTLLSSGLDIDFRHPLLGRVPPPLLTLPVENAEAATTEAAAAGRNVEIIAREHPGLRDTLSVLAGRGCRLALVETGPSTASELYEGVPAVDELWLSVFEEPELPTPYVGEAFATESRLHEVFDCTSRPCSRSEASGRWSFQRFWRSA